MPAPVAAAIITGAAGLGATALASHASGSSAKRASDMESDYSTKALDAAREERDYSRGRDEEQRDYDRRERQAETDRLLEARNYNRGEQVNYRERLSPFRDAGVRAVGRLDQGLAQNVGATVPTNSNVTGMIQIVGPNGKAYSVPASQRDHWLSKGAQIAGAS